jgi:hypothetical protein
MEAKQPISFFIYINGFGASNANTVQSFSLENAKTNEKLVMKEVTRRWSPMTISRYPMGATEEWIKEMAKYWDEDEYDEYEGQYRTIRISL